MEMSLRGAGYFFCFDGDRIGEQIELFFMSDDIGAAHLFSEKVERAMDGISQHMECLGARCVFRGGDSLVFHSPADIEEKEICHVFEDISFSVGIGRSVQAAFLSLFKAKALGRSQIERVFA